MLGQRAIAAAQVRTCGAERERGGDRQLIGGEQRHAIQRELRPAVAQQPERLVPHEVPGTGRVARLNGVLDGQTRVAVAREPRTRARMQRARQLRPAHAQLGAQRVGEQRVVPVLGIGAVETDDEDVHVRQLAQQPRGVVALQHVVAERARQAPHHRAGGEEVDPIGIELAEQLVADVVDHQPVVAAEALQRAPGTGLFAQRERREVHAGGPALGAPGQQLVAALVEREPVDGRDLCDLRLCQHQVGGCQLEQASLRPQSREGHSQPPA